MHHPTKEFSPSNFFLPILARRGDMLVLRQSVRLSSIQQPLRRLLHVTTSCRDTVKLDFESYQAPKDKQAKSPAQSIVLCHGLL